MAFPLFAPRRVLPGGEPDAGRVPLPSNTRTHGPQARGREVAALLLWTAAVFLGLALGSYIGSPGNEGAGVVPLSLGQNWVGPVGEACARGLVTLLGVVAWAMPLEMMLIG